MPAQINRTRFQRLSGSLASFARKWADITLRPYQVEAAQAVLDSIHERAGRSIVIMFSRQSGKDELSANLKTYLLSRLHHREGGIVEVNPTYKPQTINAMERLERRLQGNPLARKHWRKRSDFIRFLGRASVTFLSGDAKANVVGAVASLLLIVNEAQDIDPAVYDRNFAPMAASTNATRLFMGTAWTSRTLLSRELRAALQAQQADGNRRVFTYDADDVRQAVPAYGAYVDEQIARLGRGHPLIKTQYFNEEIDAQAGMFTPARRALMQCDPLNSNISLSGAGALPAKSKGQPIVFTPSLQGAPGAGTGSAYVFTLDVAGQDEAAFHNPDEQMLRNPGRDAVSLTVASVDLSAMDTLQAPIFRILHREQWTGLNHLSVFGRLTALADRWRPQHIVIDATGVGEGLWAMLDKRYPTRVIPVKFSAQKKSELGYRFLAMIETGRLRDCSWVRGGDLSPGAASSRHPALRSHAGAEHGRPEDERAGMNPAPTGAITASDVDRQYAACVSEVLLGPQKLMRWGVPEGTRDENGDLIHDDIVMADALLAEADVLEWRLPGRTLIIRPKDPLDEMSHFRETDR